MPTHVENPSAPQYTPQWGYPSAPHEVVPPPATSSQSTTYPSAPPLHVPSSMPTASPSSPAVPVGFNVMVSEIYVMN